MVVTEMRHKVVSTIHSITNQQAQAKTQILLINIAGSTSHEYKSRPISRQERGKP
jgi:hypothetical protein